MTTSIYLRADGGPQMGWGHVNRMCSLAAIMKGQAPVVAVATEAGAKVFQHNNSAFAAVKTLDADAAGHCYSEWEGVNTENSILVLDGYQFDYTYQQQAKALGFRVVLIDDFALGPFAADMIINHAPESRSRYSQEGIRFCCGTDYALLRPSFYQRFKEQPRRKQQVLVTLGGADPQALTGQLLNRLLPEHRNLNWVVVCTDSFAPEHRQQLEQMAAGSEHMTLEYNVSEEGMHRLMMQSSHALVSSSTVVLEAWASGLYPAALCYTENQRIMFEGVCNGHLAFPLQAATAQSGFREYLQTTPKEQDGMEGWNPPAAIRNAFQQLMHA